MTVCIGALKKNTHTHTSWLLSDERSYTQPFSVVHPGSLPLTVQMPKMSSVGKKNIIDLDLLFARKHPIQKMQTCPKISQGLRNSAAQRHF